MIDKGFFTPLFVYLLVLIFHLILPSRQVQGYVKDPATNQPYRYHLNGILVHFLAVTNWWMMGRYGILPFDWFYHTRWSSLAGSCTIGFLYSLQLILSAVPATSHKPFLVDFFLGRTLNLQYFEGRVDAKMYLYLAGAIMLQLNVLSFAAFHQIRFGTEANPGILVHAILLSFFILDYLTFEHVHLYTYDIFAERLGMKLAWGCLCFYPYFYVIGLWSTAPLPRRVTVNNPWLTFSALLFICGWLLSRGANLQKYTFKRFPTRKFLGLVRQVVLADNANRRVLCSGFWGVARHVNYLGEIFMATGLVMALGHFRNPWPWMYPSYCLLLLIPRERDDDHRCLLKYGDVWHQYRELVPYRILPGVY